jgi:hypothetical protein
MYKGPIHQEPALCGAGIQTILSKRIQEPQLLQVLKQIRIEANQKNLPVTGL